MARNGEYCPPNTLMRLRSTTEFHSVSCCGDSGQLVYHNAERVNSTCVGAECVFPGNKIVQCEVVNERLVLANLWARHFEWKISNTPELYSLAKCKWHIPMPAFVWGFGHDDVFGHWVGESLFALFHTIEEFWVRALKRQPSVDEFRRNFLIRWEDEGQWWAHHAKRMTPRSDAAGIGWQLVSRATEGRGRSHIELLQILTAGPVLRTVQDLQWQFPDRTCFDTLVVGLNVSGLTWKYPFSGPDDPRSPTWKSFRDFYRHTPYTCLTHVSTHI